MRRATDAILGPVHQVTQAPYNFEPHIAVHPQDPLHLASITIRVSKFDGRFRPRGECLFDLYLHETTDGGWTWHELRLSDGFAFDGQVVFGPDGTLYGVGLQDGMVFVHEGAVSDNVTPSNRRIIQSDHGNDKPWLTIDPETQATYVVYSGSLRAADQRWPLVIQISRDRGRNWSGPQVIEAGPTAFIDGKQVATNPWGGQALLGRQGQITVTWLCPVGLESTAIFDRRIWTATSSDGGATFSHPRLLAHARSAPNGVSHDGDMFILYTEGTLERQQLVISVSDDGDFWSKHAVSEEFALISILCPNPGLGVAPGGAVDAVFYTATSVDCLDIVACLAAREAR